MYTVSIIFGGDKMTYNDKKKAYNMQYAKKNLKRIPLDVPLAKYEEIKTHAENNNESINGYIKKAIDERIENEQ